MHRGNESLLQPFLIIDCFVGILAVDLRIVEIRILGRGMVAPDRHVADRGDIDPCLLRELRFAAIFVQPCHGKPALARDRLRVIHRDQAIGVAGVSNHQDANIGGGIFFNRLPLADKNLPVDA